MKKMLIPLLSLTILITACKKDDETEPIPATCDFIDFKYYNNAPYFLGELSNDYLVLGVDSMYNDSEIHDFISSINQFDQNYDYVIYDIIRYKFREIPLKLNSSKTCEEITQIIADLEAYTIISYAHYTMQTDNCQNAIWEQIGDLCINSYGSNFYVKVFDENDLTDLYQMITETNTEFVKQNDFMSKWYELRATKTSNGDALAMANYFHESGLFEYSEPGTSKYPVE
jgi:hypothetical protein